MMADRYQIPPWQFEAECTEYWWDRINRYNEEMDRFRKRENPSKSK